MADAVDSKSTSRKAMRVRLPPPVFTLSIGNSLADSALCEFVLVAEIRPFPTKSSKQDAKQICLRVDRFNSMTRYAGGGCCSATYTQVRKLCKCFDPSDS